LSQVKTSSIGEALSKVINIEEYQVTWPEISIDDFPHRRDDEPSSLRQDIIDELSDHFACALNRELLKNPDEATAKQRVLNQFGDPLKIARQLWLEAMKEKIMSQRIMTGISAVMAVCCIAVVGIAWSMMQRSERVNQSMLEQLAVMADRPVPAATTNLDQQFLKQMEVMMQKQIAQADSSSGAMNPVSFQLVQEEESGKPAVGFSGTLTKISAGDGDFELNAVSDENGQLDFGRLPWGKYQMNLRAPWNGHLNTLNFSTLPGRKYEDTIVCPAGVPEDVSVEFQVKWPAQPADENFYLLCDFRHVEPNAPTKEYYLQVVQSFMKNSAWPYLFWTYKRDLNQELTRGRGVFLIDVKKMQVAPCPITAEGDYENIDLQKLVWQPTAKMLQGEHFRPAIYLLRKSELAKLSELNSITTIETLTRSENRLDLNKDGKPYFGIIISPFEQFQIEPQLLKSLDKKNSTPAKQIHGYRENRPDAVSHYSSRKDQPNVWEINIPDLFPITQESGSSNKSF